MSSFNALNPADAADVKSFISGIVKHTADGTYTLSSAINPITPDTLSNDSNMILSNMGLEPTAGNISAATILANNIANGTLRSDDVSNYGDYNTNTSTSYVLSPYGDIASAMNTLFDAQASQMLDPSLQSVKNATSGTGKATTTAEGLAGAAQNNGKKSATSNATQTNISTITSADYYAKPLSDYQPKFNYTYIAQITLYGEYQNDIPVNCTFLIKKFDKPKTTVEHDEVNFYNFFSQVPKRTKFSNVTMTLHDDIKSESMNFLVAYLRRVCPIFNQEQPMNFEDGGMNFSNSNSSYGLYNTTGSLNIIHNIKIYNIYNGNRTMDVYTFNNPKIMEASLDDWGMEKMDGAEINLDFAYDNWYVNVGVAANIPQNTLGISELVAGPAVALTAKGAAYDPKYTNLLMTQESGKPTDTGVTEQPAIKDGQEGDDVLTPDQLDTVSAAPLDYKKEIADLNVQKKDPITTPAADTFSDMFKSLPPAENATVPGLNNDQLANALAPVF